MERLDVWERNRGGTERRERATFRLGQHLDRERGRMARLLTSRGQRGSHTETRQAIKARSHGAEDAAIPPPPRAK